MSKQHTERAPTLKPDGLEMLSYEILGETNKLYEDLYALANNNAAFKRGRLDAMSFEVSEGDALEPASSDEEDEDFDEDDEGDSLALVKAMLQSYVEVGYKFEARRKRELIDGQEEISMFFTFGVFARHVGVQLPPLIAATEYDLPAEEAVYQAGLVTELRSQHYSFESDEFKLMLCDSIAYLDDDDDIISQVCACPGDQDEVFYYPEEVVEYADGVFGVEETDITQHQADYAVERTENELIDFGDADKSAAAWAEMMHAGEEVDKYDFERQVQAASVLVKSIRQALLRQAGVDA
jgi:hypothetical protein